MASKKKPPVDPQIEIARLERDAKIIGELRQLVTSPPMMLITMFAGTNLASRAGIITGDQAVIIQTAVSTGEFAKIASGIINAVVPG